MKTTHWLSAMILTACLGATAYGQNYGTPPTFPAPSPLSKDGEAIQPEEPVMPTGGGMSDWILRRKDCCQGNDVPYTPLYTETYLTSGATFPVGGMTLSRELRPGFAVMGGARALFFNESMTRAWTVDLHIIDNNATGRNTGTTFPVTFPQNGTPNTINATIRDFNRVSVGLGVGREWYIWQSANSPGRMWRIGVDGGGRWGSSRVDFNEFGHLTDVVGTTYAAAHTDLEWPCGHYLFHTGLRFEWAYTWSTILQRVSDVQELGLMVTAGIRF